MQYTFRGRLCGYICPDTEEPLSNMTVRLYRPDRPEREIVAAATAEVKETFAVLDDEDVKAKDDRLLAETETDDEGEFSIELGDDHDYDGEAFEIDVRTDHVPGEYEEDADPVQFTITTLQPRWRQAEEGAVADWDYCIPRRFWCDIRQLFGAWVICGRVTDCETEQPLAGMQVTAFDTDIFQRDELGTATTGANGAFRIYYRRSDFERVPAPWSPIELVGGPDLHFEISDGSGTQLLVEQPSRGRQSDRENAGPCFRVDLCVDLPEGPPSPPTVEPQFTHVGEYQITTEITSNGYAMEGSDELAFTGTIPLIGALPFGASAAPREYRFRIAEYTNGSTGASQPLDASMIAPTRIGSLQYWDETSPGTWTLESDEYWLNHPSKPNNVSVKPGGWIEVPRDNDPGSPGTTGSGLFVRSSDRLANFDTRQLLLETFDLTSPSDYVAGSGLDPGQKSEVHTYELVFETREIDPATGTPVSGTLRQDTLSKIVISNTEFTQHRHPSWSGDTPTLRGVVMLDIQEFRSAGNGCRRLEDDLNALVTAYHPHLNSARIRFEGQPPLPGPRNLSIAADGEASSTEHFDISSLQPCAYNIWLDVTYDLTHGNGRISGQHDHIGFCIADSTTP